MHALWSKEISNGVLAEIILPAAGSILPLYVKLTFTDFSVKAGFVIVRVRSVRLNQE